VETLSLKLLFYLLSVHNLLVSRLEAFIFEANRPEPFVDVSTFSLVETYVLLQSTVARNFAMTITMCMKQG